MDNILMVKIRIFENIRKYCLIHFIGEETESQDDLLGLAELTSDELKAAFRL